MTAINNTGIYCSYLYTIYEYMTKFRGLSNILLLLLNSSILLFLMHQLSG